MAFAPTAYTNETPIPAVTPIPSCDATLKKYFSFISDEKFLVLRGTVIVLLTSLTIVDDVCPVPEIPLATLRTLFSP